LERFRDPSARATIPDPGDVITFERSALDWQSAGEPCHRDWLEFYRHLLHLRKEKILPLLRESGPVDAHFAVHGKRAFSSQWQFPAGSKLALVANFSPVPVSKILAPGADVLYTTSQQALAALDLGALPGWSAVWFQS